MRNYAIAILIAFLGVVWCANHYGGLCNYAPIFLGIVGFSGVIALVIVDAARSVDGRRGAMLCFGGAAAVLVATLTAAGISRSMKDSLQIVDIGISVGVARGRVVKAETWFSHVNEYTVHPYKRCKVTFSYEAEGGRFQQCDYFKKRILKAGQHVKVLYLLARPAVARLLKPGETLPEDAGL